MIKEDEQKEMLLILDLDETLIHSSEKKLTGIDPDFNVGHFFVYKRPYLDDFLEYCNKHFRLAVWSSASDDYVKEIINYIIPYDIKLEFTWGQSRCTLKRPALRSQSNLLVYKSDYYEYTKQIKKVKRKGYNLGKVLIIDDIPAMVENCYGNAIYVKEFFGVPDNELKLLIRYLEKIKSVEHVRKIEKRFWKKEADI